MNSVRITCETDVAKVLKMHGFKAEGIKAQIKTKTTDFFFFKSKENNGVRERKKEMKNDHSSLSKVRSGQKAQNVFFACLYVCFSLPSAPKTNAKHNKRIMYEWNESDR